MNDLSKTAVLEVRNEIDQSLSIINDFCVKSQFNTTQEDIKFFTFLIKKSIFFSDLIEFDNHFNKPLKKQLKADCIDLIKLFIIADRRPINLTFRSIFENYIRLIQQSSRPIVHYDWKLLESFINDHHLENEKPYFHGLYSKLSTEIHFHAKDTSLTEYVSEFLQDKPIPPKNRNKLYHEIISTFYLLENCFVQDNPERILMIYHRRTSVVKILLSRDSENFIRSYNK